MTLFKGKQLLGTEEIRFNTTMLRSFGLFTQVAWWSLREVGCGAMVYWPRTMTQSVMVRKAVAKASSHTMSFAIVVVIAVAVVAVVVLETNLSLLGIEL